MKFHPYVFPAAAVLASLGFVVFSCFVVFKYSHAIPYQDSWGMVQFYKGYLEGTLGFQDFWAAHNEHRITILRALFLLDYSLEQGVGLLLIAITLTLQGLHAALLGRSLWRIEALSSRERVFLSCSIFVILFWLVQSGNFNWPFQVAWYLNGLAASLAAYLICGLKRENGNAANGKRLLAAALCCTVAAYNVANGLFLCGILLPVLWKARLPRRFLVFWLLFCAALGASYFAGPAAADSPVHEAAPLDMLRYFLIYLGNPVSRCSLLAGSVLGAAGLVLALSHARRFLAAPKLVFFEAFAFAQLTYVLITAALTAVGRTGEFGFEQATSSRYYTTVLVFWLFLFTAAYQTYGRAGHTRFWVRLGAVALLLLFILPVQILSVPQRRVRYVKADEGALAFITSVSDTAAVHYLFPVDSYAWDQNAFLKEKRLSVYRESWPHAQGERLSKHFIVDPAAGLLLAIRERTFLPQAGRQGYFVQGEISGAGSVPEVILFTRAGVVVGAAKTKHRPCGGCFTGYVSGRDSLFDAYALEEGSRRALRILR